MSKIYLTMALATVPIFGEDLNKKLSNQTGAFANGAGLQAVRLGQVVANVIMAFLSILGLVFIGLIVYAGYLWMTARGNKDRVEKAQDILKSAIWGIIITLSAYSIAYFVLNYAFTGTAPTPEGGSYPQ